MSKLKNEDKAFKMDFSLVNDTDDNENRINKSTHRDYIDCLMDFSLNGISITPCNESFDIGPPRFGNFSSVSEYLIYRQIFPDCF
ncbi:hypothetical protein [Gilliamella sp. ESL0443]|uniref:hypothetical protein n=1 Tax=Gilliamella sp. ESL0443 TaxID=2704655 RepID=UPI001C69B27E|nr:hypothetical protein [Gilliamella sp. ESL0443]QYN41984.1 hypothetical protein GYM76_04120 [Gilliamella sp. ESL0443]